MTEKLDSDCSRHSAREDSKLSSVARRVPSADDGFHKQLRMIWPRLGREQGTGREIPTLQGL